MSVRVRVQDWTAGSYASCSAVQTSGYDADEVVLVLCCIIKWYSGICKRRAWRSPHTRTARWLHVRTSRYVGIGITCSCSTRFEPDLTMAACWCLGRNIYISRYSLMATASTQPPRTLMPIRTMVRMAHVRLAGSRGGANNDKITGKSR